MELFLNDKLGKITYEIDEATTTKSVLILAHGAGAGMNHPFMADLAKQLAHKGITTIRFNFPYMEQGRKSPGSPKSNILCWELVVDHVRKTYSQSPIFLSGKSYGGRMASHLVAEAKYLDVKGIIYFGFPLHAPGKDSTDRASHLKDIEVPQLFIQGSKDKLANLSMMKEVISALKNTSLEIFDDADHSFKVPKKSGLTPDKVIESIATLSINWMESIN